MNSSPALLSPVRQRTTIATLMSMEFLNVMDFLVIMPLAPQLMERLSISLQQFGILVAAYSVGAAAAGTLGALFVDRFDRKKAILALFSLFTLATLVCAFAPSFVVLLLARFLAGMGAGSMEALSYTIIGDVFPEDKRAQAAGQLLAAYALATVLGVPAGLFLASSFVWNAPFLAVSALGASLCVAGLFLLQPMVGHRALQTSENAWHGFKHVLQIGHHRLALVCTTVLMFGSFSVVPYMGAYFTNNLGVSEEQLPIAYLVAGGCAVFTAPAVGWLADRYGKYRVFAMMGLGALVPVLLLTQVALTSFIVIVACGAMLMVFISGYYIPAMALITSSADPRYRGRFMSINTTFEQMAIGGTTALTGMLLDTGPNGEVVGYGTVGILAVVVILLAIVLMHRLPASRETTGGGETERSLAG